MKKIVLISNYWHFPFEKASSRYNSIIEMLSDNAEYDVELITSNFRHITKTHRNYDDNIFNKYKYKVTFLNEPGYNKNVSFRRIFSHFIFSKNLKKYLKSKNDIDIIYSFVPSLSANIAITKYCLKNKIEHVIDILDLWPEAFQMVFNIPIISNIIFYPMKVQANYVYKNADKIIAVSNTYVNRALRVNKKINNGLSTYIGIDLSFFDKCKKENTINFKDDLIRIVYIGTLGTSYDIRSIIDAIDIIIRNGFRNIKFIVMGDGPLKKHFEKYANFKNIDCEFTGRLNYPKMVGLLCACDIAVNPIVGKSVASIINKVADYSAASLPVINTQNSKEYRDLLNDYNAGLNCINGDANDIAEKISIFITNKDLRLKYGKNSRILAEREFNRNETYNKIIKEINK